MLVAAFAAFAGVFYFSTRGTDGVTPGNANALPGKVSVAPGAGADAPSKPSAGGGSAAPVSDPRLAVFRLSPDNGLIDFVAGADGRVIKEVDRDPRSPGFGKPLREYSYAGDKVVALTTYDYGGAQVRVTRVHVSYRPDGSVDQFRESTDFLAR
jgi:hypothetical protein